MPLRLSRPAVGLALPVPPGLLGLSSDAPGPAPDKKPRRVEEEEDKPPPKVARIEAEDPGATG